MFMQMMASAVRIGQGICSTFSTSGAFTLASSMEVVQAEMLARASALGSDGQNVGPGGCRAKSRSSFIFVLSVAGATLKKLYVVQIAHS
jgi:hypothetical protein